MMKSKKVRVFYDLWEQQDGVGLWKCDTFGISLAFFNFYFNVNVVGDGNGVEPMDDKNK